MELGNYWAHPEADTIGPLLPMHYLTFADAVILANAMSSWSGLGEAYEFHGGNEQSHIGNQTSIRFRHTGQRGFRLPTAREWEAFAPRDGQGRPDRFRCLHGNLNDEGGTCFDGFRFLAPIASYKPTRRGLYDLWGNALEWGEPSSDTFESDGWWVEKSFDWLRLRVPNLGSSYVSFPEDVDSGYYAASMPSLPKSQSRIYGLGLRLVIEPDRRGRCPTLNLPWTHE